MIAAAYIIFAVQICVVLFQLALALGAPMGEYTLGGQNIGRLSMKLRFATTISLLINLGIAGHYLAQTGTLQALLPSNLNAIVNWALVGFFGLGLLMNSISRSKKERNLWVPVLILSLVCAVIVALG
ncbi:hypothetical protein [Rhodoluna lacicola]|uniref:Uncharacterized protein n=1 Tax=Rhodoluna lacicola TaxID=529884 RepID=A0A060JH41_9MICO|nr:hypothetical protein [Rhodoluna lacicola]AIC47867.1 hypothetical protein Rhola_00010720 [Rhodoluna lacicola]